MKTIKKEIKKGYDPKSTATARKVARLVITAMRLKYGRRYAYEALCYKEDGEMTIAIEIADDKKGEKIPREAVKLLKDLMKIAGCRKIQGLDVGGDPMVDDVAYTRIYSTWKGL